MCGESTRAILDRIGCLRDRLNALTWPRPIESRPRSWVFSRSPARWRFAPRRRSILSSPGAERLPAVQYRAVSCRSLINCRPASGPIRRAPAASPVASGEVKKPRSIGSTRRMLVCGGISPADHRRTPARPAR
jgi:hypothetical protein